MTNWLHNWMLGTLTWAACAIAHAGEIVVLDTYPVSGVADGPDAQFYARLSDVQQLALPFVAPADGRVTQVHTGLQHQYGLCGLRIGIMAYDSLDGSVSLPSLSVNAWADFADVTAAPNLIGCGSQTFGTTISRDEDIVLRDLDWALTAGLYALVVAARSDMEEALWSTNAAMFSDGWLMQASGRRAGTSAYHPCTEFGLNSPWKTLQECGMSPEALPVARITFEAAHRVPEPPTLVLLALGLFSCGIASASVRLWKSQ